MKKNKWRVWDLPVRLLHWTLVPTIAAAWVTSSRLGPAHEILGYIASGLMGARVLWGFVGSRYARFTQFVRTPDTTRRYLRSVLAAHAPRYIGHNPLGGWMVLALLGCVAALGFTGWLYTTDMFWGYGWLANLHAGLGWTLLVLIALHVSGVVLTSWQHRENLVRAMVTGDKAPPQGDDVA